MTLIGLIVLWGGYNIVYSWIWQPIVDKKGQIAQLESDIEKEEQNIAKLKKAQRDLKDWTERSLPPNDTNAHRLYQTWLTHLAEVVGYDELVVEPLGRQPKWIGRGRTRKRLYTAIQVRMEWKTTFDRLARFLYYFHRAKLMHRVADISIRSEGNEGNPKLAVKMTLEALALGAAKPRNRLFPETELKSIDTDRMQLTVADADGFPKKGEFHVRVGEQLLTVLKADGTNWTVRVGVDPPSKDNPDLENEFLKSQPAGTLVQLAPVDIDKDKMLAFYRNEVYGSRSSPFVLPVEFTPRLHVSGQTTIYRGDTLRLEAKAVGLDPEKGRARFFLGKNAPKGMTIDEQSGKIVWKPADDVAERRFSIDVFLAQGDVQTPILKESVPISISSINRSPTVTVEQRHSMYAGETLTFQARGSDPDGKGVRYSLSNAPTGARIDSQTGKFEWNVPYDAEPKTYEFEIVVSDNGSPPRQVTSTVSVKVEHKPERYAKLVGILTEDGERVAWIYNIAENKKTVIQEGTPFDVAGIKGFLYVIGSDFVEFQSGDVSYILRLGQFLSDRTKIVAPKPKTAGKASSRVSEPRKSGDQ